MSDEEDSMSEGFSASEDEWKPTKNVKGGESSDDDDSDFEESPIATAAGGGTASGGSSAGAARKRGEPKARSAAKQTSSKKRTGLSLRAKLYNKYRPPPKTYSPPSSEAMGKNSPSASTSRTNSKNATAPNESKSIRPKNNHDDGNDTDSSSGSSIDNYLVHPEDLDLQSSFFNVEARPAKKPSVSPVPVFDCNAGLGNLTDSESDNTEEAEGQKNTKAFDFKHLLDYANNLEQVKENLKHAAEDSAADAKKKSSNIDTLDVYAVLALGEKLQNRSHNDGEDEDDEDDGGGDKVDRRSSKAPPSKLNKTKSTRIKRHTKTRPTSTVAADDTDDSDWEEVADSAESIDTTATSSDVSQIGNLEIHVELPSRHRDKKTKTQLDLEMALKRKLNRDIKERQILLHKTSLLCHFGRTFFYNRLLNDTGLMQKALELLPSSNAYPPDRGTEIKYYQSLVTWFKTAIKLLSPNLYPEKSAAKTKAKARKELLKQIEKKVARSKQDMVFLFVILLRGMGLQCRLIVNMQPMPLKPAQSDLLQIKMKKDDENGDKKSSVSSKKAIKKDEQDSDQKPSTSSSARIKMAKQNSKDKEHKIEELKKEKASTSKKIDSKAPALDKKEAKEKLSKKDHETSVDGKIGKEKHIKITKKVVLSEVKSSKGYDEEMSKSCPIVVKTKQLPEEEPPVDKSKGFEEMLKSCSRVVKSAGKEPMKSNSKTCPRIEKQTKKDAENNHETENTSKAKQNARPKVTKETLEKDQKEKTSKTKTEKSKTIDTAKNSGATLEVEILASKTKVEKLKIIDTAKSSTTLENKVSTVREQQQIQVANAENLLQVVNTPDELENSQKENATKALKKPTLARLKRIKATDDKDANEQKPKKKPIIETGSPVIPKIVVQGGKDINEKEQELPTTSRQTRSRSRSKSPQTHISTAFLLKGQQYKEKFPGIIQQNTNKKTKPIRVKSPINKVKISTDFMKNHPATDVKKRILRSRQKPNETPQEDEKQTQIPQLDGADDDLEDKVVKSKRSKNKRPKIEELTKEIASTSKKIDSKAPALDKKEAKEKKDDENGDKNSSVSSKKAKKDEKDSDTDQKPSTSSSSRIKMAKQNSKDKEHKIEELKKEKASTSKKIDSKAPALDKKEAKEKLLKKDHETSVDGKIGKEKHIKITNKVVLSEVKSSKGYDEEMSKSCPRVVKTKQLPEEEPPVDKSKGFEEMLKSCSRVVKSADKEPLKSNSKTCPRIEKQTRKEAENNHETENTSKAKQKARPKVIKETLEQDQKEKTSKTKKSKTIDAAKNSAPTLEVEVLASKTKVEKPKIIDTAKSSTTLENKASTVREQQQIQETNADNLLQVVNTPDELENSQKENETKAIKKPTLARLKRIKATDDKDANEQKPKQKPIIETGSPVIPKIVVQGGKDINEKEQELPTFSRQTRSRSRSKSPQAHISTAFLLKGQQYKEKFPGIIQQSTNKKTKPIRAKSPINKVKISTDFMKNHPATDVNKRILRSRQKPNETAQKYDSHSTKIPQLDGADDDHEDRVVKSKRSKNKRPNIKKLKVQRSTEDSDEDFEPSPPKKPKTAPAKTKPDRRVLTSDDENSKAESPEREKRKQTAGDLWVEVWSDVEEQWVCVDLFKGKLHCVDTIRKSASPNLSYVFAFQNDLSIKDVTARYCPHWTTTVRKARVEKAWLDTAISNYLGHRTKRDIKEDQDLRAIHEQKPMPTAIGDYKNHPFYALERHLLKFEALYPPEAPPLGYIRGEAVYSRDCVHCLHSREIWLKQARTVKLGEKPYKIVKARPKWDRITQTVIKDQPLEIFGYWQTQDYEPPTAENGLVPRNAYGNVELFKACMLPKKTVHLRLPGLNRVCRKLNVDCANAVVGFDFHQGSCHPTYDGFIVCEEFQDQVVAAWHQDQEDQERKEQEKYEARVYGNWKKLIRGLLIRERLKLKYNF